MRPKQSECHEGHPLIEGNLYYWQGRRRCKRCALAAHTWNRKNLKVKPRAIRKAVLRCVDCTTSGTFETEEQLFKHLETCKGYQRAMRRRA